MLEGTRSDRPRLPFTFHATGGIGRLVLADLDVAPLHIDRLELEVTDLGTDPGTIAAERFQRRRTRLRALAIRISGPALEARVAQVKKPLAALGVTGLNARLNDGFVSVRARATDGLAAADLSFRVVLVHAGTQLRAIASHIRIHGHLPTPGPILADRILATLLDAGAPSEESSRERPQVRGLIDVEVDLTGALLWHLMPPHGWRLPTIASTELVTLKIGRSAIEIAYGPPGARTGELGVRPSALQLAAAHDLMHSVDQELRDARLDEAMRGYRALLAAGGPDQPLLLERILALAAARPAWFFDGLELARQALGRWPGFPAAHAALASITLAQGDAREAAAHLMQLAQLASADGDDDQAALAALAGARLLRVLEPRAATQLYQLALEHDPGSAEAADSLADRLADEHRWPELVRLLRARAVSTAERDRAVALRLRLADVLVHQLADTAGAQQELAAARELAPDDPAVHEMSATVLASIDPPRAREGWREVARLAEARGDHRTCARAWATLGNLERDDAPDAAEAAWRKALELDPLQVDALARLAEAAAARGDHAQAADHYERLRGLGLPQQAQGRFELQLARSHVVLGRIDDARSSLRRATLSGGETAAEAHAVLAEVAEASADREHAAAELDTAIVSFVDLAACDTGDGERLYTRAAQLAVARAVLFDRDGQRGAAAADYQRAHALAQHHAPELARGAAQTMLARSDDAHSERRWIDAVLATRPPPLERATLLVRRADVRRRERSPDLAAALADLHEGMQLAEDHDTPAASEEVADLRRRAYQLEADLLAQSGDQRARAQALASLAKLARRAAERIEVESAAAAAWLAADDAASALPLGARALASIDAGASEVSPALRREVLVTLGEAAWRQRAWPDVIRAYRGLLEGAGADTADEATQRYRLAVAAERSGEQATALEALRPLVLASSAATDDDAGTGDDTMPAELRSQAQRLYADLAERAGDLPAAAAALEAFAATAGPETSAITRADAMYRAGELFRRADRPDDTVRCLETALRIADTHLPSLDALEATWRERGDHERVAVILGRKVAATARHPARQKPLLSRLGDLQDKLGRPDVALATHQRALEIDPAWRPSLRYVTRRLHETAQPVAAAGGLAQLAGELPGDHALDLATVTREREEAARALAELVATVDDARLDGIRELAQVVVDRLPATAAGERARARLRGEPLPDLPEVPVEDTASGRLVAGAGARSLRDAAARARAAGKPHDAFAALETANHVGPGDPAVLRELVDLASEVADHLAAARHLAALAGLATGARRGDLLLELADVYYDRLDEPQRGRQAMRDAATAFGSGMRRDTTLRMLASEASAHLAWDVAVEALTAIAADRRGGADLRALAIALVRAGHDADAIALLEDPGVAARLDDDGALLAQLRADATRKARLAVDLERRAELGDSLTADPAELRAEAREVRDAVGGDAVARAEALPGETTLEPEAIELPAEARTRTLPGTGTSDVDPAPPALARLRLLSVPPSVATAPPVIEIDRRDVSVVIEGSPMEAARAVALAAASADRDRLLAAHREQPDDTSLLLAVLAHLGDGEPELRTAILREAAARPAGPTREIAIAELARLGLAPTTHAADTEAALARARALADAEDWAGAIAAAEDAAALDPEALAPLALLQQLYQETGDVTAASEAIGRQLVLAADTTQRAILWRRRARLYRDTLERDAEAYRCLKEAHACAPEDPEIAYQLRLAAMARAEWALVASLLYREIAAAGNPRDRGALHLELALVFDHRLDDPAQAQVNYEQALAFDPTIPAAKPPLARRYEALGRDEAAARLFDEAATTARPAERAELRAAAARARSRAQAEGLDAEHAELVAQLDRAETAGDRDVATQLARQLWEADRGHLAAFRVLAHHHQGAKELAALTELTAAAIRRIDTPADRATAWLEVARLAEELGAFDQAARAYDHALIEDPAHPGALDARGALAFRLGDFATADLIYRDLDSGESMLGSDELALRRSIIAERLGRDTEALTHAISAAERAAGRRDLLLRVQELAVRCADVEAALRAARTMLELVPLDDEPAQLATHFAIVDLHRQVGDLDGAIAQVERILRDHPLHAPALELLVELHGARDDWNAAARYLYQLVPLAASPAERADRLYRLGDVILLHLEDPDRADDVFLRASDLDPAHVPTLRRLLDVYWRADDAMSLVDVASELASKSALAPSEPRALAHALVAAALVGDTRLVQQVAHSLGTETARFVAAAIDELAGRKGRLRPDAARSAIADLARRGVLTIHLPEDPSQA